MIVTLRNARGPVDNRRIATDTTAQTPTRMMPGMTR